MMPPCGSDVSCIAFATGTAVFAVLHWLLELRYGPSTPGIGCSCSKQFVKLLDSLELLWALSCHIVIANLLSPSLVLFRMAAE